MSYRKAELIPNDENIENMDTSLNIIEPKVEVKKEFEFNENFLSVLEDMVHKIINKNNYKSTPILKKLYEPKLFKAKIIPKHSIKKVKPKSSRKSQKSKNPVTKRKQKINKIKN